MLLASYLAAAASSSLARRGRRAPVSLRSFAAASISAGGNDNKGGGSKQQQQQQRRLPAPSSSPPPLPPLPVVVLLGRPNVGKSALFNRLTGSRQALVRDTPGSHVTRDWRSSEAGRLGDLRFEVVDTSGLEEQEQQRGHQKQKQQPRRKGVGVGAVLDDGGGGAGGLGSRAAALTAGLLRQRADVALLLLDAKDGVTPVDEALARWLRRSLGSGSAAAFPTDNRRPPAAVVVAVNKAEAARSSPRVAAAVAEAGALGFGEGVGVSAETGEGMAELYAALAPTLDAAAERLREEEAEEEMALEEEGEEEEGEEEQGEDGRRRNGPMRVALVGAPNAGKSTLSNALLGSERSLTGPEPGLTRDAVWATLEWVPPQMKEALSSSSSSPSSSSSSSPSSSSSSPRPKPRVVELIDTAGWDRRTARAASIGKRNGDEGDDRDDGDRHHHSGGKENRASASAAATAAASPSSPSPASALLAPADVIAEAMRQTERGINLAHVVVVVVDLAAAAARADASSSSSAPVGLDLGAPAARARRGDDGGAAAAAAAPQVLSRTEIALASRAAEAGRAVVFVGAKADLLLKNGSSGSSSSVEKSPAVAAAARALALDVSRRLPQLAGAPVLALSAATGAGLRDLLPAVARAHAAWDGRVPTSALNKWLEGAKAAAGASSSSGSSRDAAARSLARVRYLTQASSRPPSFVAFARGGARRGGGGTGGGSSSTKTTGAAAARAADERLEKMLSNRLRAEFGMRGVPIRVAVRGPSSSSSGDYRRRR